jgi:DNA-binding beta-propeller fold protein YncE
MNKTFASLLAVAAFALNARAVEFKAVPDWAKLPEGRPQIGNMHGDIAVSAAGEVYASVMDPKAGVQVYGKDGKWLRNVPNAPSDFHGFVIHKDADGTEYIYGPRLGGGNILKLTLDGKEVLNIPSSAIPDDFKVKTKEGKPRVALTGMDVAPDGDLYVTDGYASSYVHRFDKTGKHIKSFGGKKAPYNFTTLHKIAVDTRFTPIRIIACDREAMRVVHLSTDGELLGVVAKDLLAPAAICVQGDYALVGEIRGAVSVLDKEGKLVTKVSINTEKGETGTNQTKPEKWRPGIVTAPHGVAFNANGDIFVSEYSIFGRIHRFNKN